MISWAVVGHEERIIAATDLARQLDAIITVDNGVLGADANHIKAWDLTATQDQPWSAVVEDDALPVHGFLEQAEQALTVAPAPVVSFYLGRARPIRWQNRIHAALQHVDLECAHWITTSHVLHAVAVAMHTSLREDWLTFARASRLPADERLSAWCKYRGHRVAYTVPSLVEHADWPTLVAHRDRLPRDSARTAWRTGIRDRWNDHAIPM